MNFDYMNKRSITLANHILKNRRCSLAKLFWKSYQ